MYAIVEASGKQQKVKKGDVIYTESLGVEEGNTTEFEVVAFSEKDTLKIGKPYLDGVKVVGKILKNSYQKKISVFTYKPKKHQKRKLGHKQPYTKVEIVSINS